MKQELPKKIMKEIRARGVLPYPRWYFLAKNFLLWCCVILSIMFGGLFIAMIIFRFIDHDGDIQIYQSETMFEDVWMAVPLLWLLTTTVLIGIIKYTLSRVEFGYRYTTVRIMGLVLLSSIVWSIILQYLDIAQWMGQW